MKQIAWDDSLSVGIEFIDEQHRTWIGHFNKVAGVLESGEAPEKIAETLGFLMDYTQVHFATEEKHMSLLSYPGLKEHKDKHHELKRTLGDMVQDYEEEGATHPLAHALDNLLRNWLIGHIRDVDARFGAFVRDKGLEVQGDSAPS